MFERTLNDQPIPILVYHQIDVAPSKGVRLSSESRQSSTTTQRVINRLAIEIPSVSRKSKDRQRDQLQVQPAKPKNAVMMNGHLLPGRRTASSRSINRNSTTAKTLYIGALRSPSRMAK